MNEMCLVKARDCLHLCARIWFTLIDTLSNSIQRLKINILRALRENEDIDVVCLSQTWQMLQARRVLAMFQKSKVIKFEPEYKDLEGLVGRKPQSDACKRQNLATHKLVPRLTDALCYTFETLFTLCCR